MMRPVRSPSPLVVWTLALILAGPLALTLVTRSLAAPDLDDLQLLLRQSFKDRGGRMVQEVLGQDEMQKACSAAQGGALPPEQAEKLRAGALASVRFPAGDQWLGRWKAGEAIAQNGRGLQYSDPAGQPAGGNCYACHQLSAKEQAYGSLGPSLLGYGRLHGRDTATLQRAWLQLWNPHAITPCSMMPRFGAQGILNMDQLRDLMALLFDPDSPVNQPP